MRSELPKKEFSQKSPQHTEGTAGPNKRRRPVAVLSICTLLMAVLSLSTWFVSGCQEVCTRDSDCAYGRVCSAKGICVAKAGQLVDAGFNPFADGGVRDGRAVDAGGTDADSGMQIDADGEVIVDNDSGAIVVDGARDSAIDSAFEGVP